MIPTREIPHAYQSSLETHNVSTDLYLVNLLYTALQYKILQNTHKIKLIKRNHCQQHRKLADLSSTPYIEHRNKPCLTLACQNFEHDVQCWENFNYIGP